MATKKQNIEILEELEDKSKEKKIKKIEELEKKAKERYINFTNWEEVIECLHDDDLEEYKKLVKEVYGITY